MVVPLVLILALGAGLYLSIAPKGPVAEFRVLVRTAEGENLDGATVEVYDGTLILDQAQSVDGVAVFRNLPSKLLTFKVTKQGLKPLERTVEVSAQRASTRLELEQTVQNVTTTLLKRGFKITLNILDAKNSTPVSGARIVYSFGVGSAGLESTTSDAQGKAILDVPKDSTVRVSITHEQYRTRDTTILATKAAEFVSLEPRARAAAFFSSQGKLTVTVLDETGNSVSDGTVKAHHSDTGVFITSSSISGGKAEIRANQGTKIKVSVESTGFLPYTSQTTLVIAENSAHVARLTRATSENSNTTRITILNEAGQPIDATVRLYPYPGNTLILTQRVNASGVWQPTLARGVGYYVLVTAPGRVTTVSDTFLAGESIELRLASATELNSGNLTVTVTDKRLNNLVGVSLAIYTASGLLAAPPATTDAQGTVVFASLPLHDYLIQGRQGPLAGESAVALDASQGITLKLNPEPARVSVRGVDVSTSLGLAARFEAFSEAGPSIGTCTAEATGSCELTVPADERVTLVGTSPNYGNATLVIEFASGGSDDKTLYFLPAVLLQETRVEFKGVFDPITGLATRVLKRGGAYLARFVVSAPAGVDSFGLMVRVGELSSAGDDVAAFVPDISTVASLATSTTYTPGPNCTDLENREGAYLKWVQFTFPAGGQAFTQEIPLVVFENSAPTTFPLYYRAFSQKNNASSRVPVDERFGVALTTQMLDGCYANSLEERLEIIVPGQSATPTITSDFTPTLKVWFDGVNLRSDAREITLQIDPIFPADALPLDLDSRQVLVLALNSTAGTERCYRFDFNRKLFTFESGDSNPECSINVTGNRIQGDDSTTVTFAYTSDVSKKVTIPIKVVAKRMDPIQTVYVQPDSLSGDSAQLIYLINQKQLGGRVLSVSHPDGEKQVSFARENPVDLQVLAWRGPGELSIGEGAETLNSLSYSYVASYFPATQGIGRGSVLSRDCEGFLCCTRGWCTSTAAQAAMDDFGRQTQAIARLTAFRRGKGEPFKHFVTDRPFRFVTAVQLKQGARLGSPVIASEEETSGTGTSTQAPSNLYRLLFANPQQNLALQATATPAPTLTPTPSPFETVIQAQRGCVTGDPHVYTVTAESEDGQNFSYSARPSSLYTVNYVTGACPGEQGIEAAREAGGDSIPLCGFLFGEGECVRRTSAPLSVNGPQLDFDEGSDLGQTLLLTLGIVAAPALITAGISGASALFSSGSGSGTVTSGGGAGDSSGTSSCDAAGANFERAYTGTNNLCKDACSDEFVRLRSEVRKCYGETAPADAAQCKTKLQELDHQTGLNFQQGCEQDCLGLSGHFTMSQAQAVKKAADCNTFSGSKQEACNQCFRRVSECVVAFNNEFDRAAVCDTVGEKPGDYSGGKNMPFTCYSHPDFKGDPDVGKCVKTCMPVCGYSECKLDPEKKSRFLFVFRLQPWGCEPKVSSVGPNCEVTEAPSPSDKDLDLTRTQLDRGFTDVCKPNNNVLLLLTPADKYQGDTCTLPLKKPTIENWPLADKTKQDNRENPPAPTMRCDYVPGPDSPIRVPVASAAVCLGRGVRCTRSGTACCGTDVCGFDTGELRCLQACTSPGQYPSRDECELGISITMRVQCTDDSATSCWRRVPIPPGG